MSYTRSIENKEVRQMQNSNRLRDFIQELRLQQPVITDLRNGMTEVRWVSAIRGNRVYHRSVCARSIGGMMAALERATSN